MSNTQKTRSAAQNGSKKGKTYKFATMKREADKHRANQPVAKEIDPFVIDDVDPPIKITAPDTLERQLVISDFVGQWKSGNWDMSNSIHLLRALCGEQFGRVWMLIKDDPDPAVMIELVNAMFEHFKDALEIAEEAGELPGGSEGS